MASSSAFSPLSIFFFSGSCHHRDLHSFPTRRSSDLFRAPVGLGEVVDIGVRPSRLGTKSFELEYELRSAGRVVAEAKRSEEHTSELQSLRHLVCRLLLEKKKKKRSKIICKVT